MTGFDWPSHIQFGVSLFALMAPINIAPVFIALTSDMDNRARVFCATVACATAFVILTLSYLFGETIISTMGTSLPSFQIAGGIIIALAGFSMMSEHHIPSEDDVETDKGASALHIGVAPIGTPLLGGAGAITKVMLEGHEEASAIHEGSVLMIILLVAGAAWAILVGAGMLVRYLGHSGIQVFQRIFGLILMAIGVEILVSGILGHADKFALTH